MRRFLPSLGVILWLGFSAREAGAQTVNNWTNPVSGNWEDLCWSLGTRPGSDQWVIIGNPGWKAVGIGSDTTAGFPGTLTVQKLEVSAPTGDANTLLLNYADTAVPLRVLDSIVIGSNGTLMNFSSGVVAGSNGLWVAGGQVIQSGGFLHATNAVSKLDGIYNLTNGAMRLRQLDAATFATGTFTQVGGSVNVSNLNLGRQSSASTFIPGYYELAEGFLESDTVTAGAFGGPGKFTQTGGTNRARMVQVGSWRPDEFGPGGEFALAGGALLADTIKVGLVSLNSGSFVQSGGQCVATNSVNVAGSSRTHANSHGIRSSFRMTGGSLSTPAVNVYTYGSFGLAGGTMSITGTFDVHGSATYYAPETFAGLDGGFLGCSNLVCYSADFWQGGGTLWVTNLMTVSGSYCGGPDYYCSPSYRLSNGTLIARDLEVRGRFWMSGGVAQITNTVTLIGTSGFTPEFPSNHVSAGTLRCSALSSVLRDLTLSGGEVTASNSFNFSGVLFNFGLPLPIGYATASITGAKLTSSNMAIGAHLRLGPGKGRITNGGSFSLGGYLTAANADERFGRFILQARQAFGPVSISLEGTTNRLAFGDSRAESWSASENLWITNWSGSVYGGGNDQIKFGTNSGGLTPTQVAQIKFQNPAGFPAGTYNARMLNSGEVVPAVGPLLYPAISAGKIIFSWSNATALQTATNVMGPFVDVAGATSPYTNTAVVDKQRFFRLRQ